MNYKKINKEDIDFLKSVCDNEKIFIGKNEINEDFSHDELGGIEKYPEVLVEVVSTE